MGISKDTKGTKQVVTINVSHWAGIYFLVNSALIEGVICIGPFPLCEIQFKYDYYLDTVDHIKFFTHSIVETVRIFVILK